MNQQPHKSPDGEATAADPVDGANTIERDGAAEAPTLSPLPGEPGIADLAVRQRFSMSKKGLLAVGLLLTGLTAVAGFTMHRFATGGKPSEDKATQLVQDQPAAATAEPRRLEMPVASAASDAATGQADVATPRIPALIPTSAEAAEPIGVRRTGATGTGASGQRHPTVLPPEDAPIMLVSTQPGALLSPGSVPGPSPAGGHPSLSDGEPSDTPGQGNPDDPLAATSRNLQGYQRQLQGLMDNLTKAATQATGHASTQAGGQGLSGAISSIPSSGGLPPSGGTSGVGGSSVGGLFGGQLAGSSTPKVAARPLGDRSLTLPKGTAFTCALKTKVISATSGLVGCQVQRNVFSDDGRVLLIERGSHLDGEYRIASVRPGTVRIPVLWTRIRTPLGVTVDLDSPGTGPLGESGIPGHVDNRWMERIGAAMLLSLIDDSVKLVIQNQANDSGADTIVLPSSTANTSKLAEKVLDSTINIPPLIYQNHGGIVGIYVARDVDFSSVYELQPTALEAPQGAAR